ncbi:MAG: dTDP-4-dehydrorhamnose reductase [Leptospira sp.]|nr:dTDP-4-dehydrorhamnose reductase [Leptospira sp.]
MKTILVTGSNGQLGNELRILSEIEEDIHFVFTDLEEMDITSTESIDSFLKSIPGDTEIIAIINAAAYTAVDKAESDQDLAYKVNVIGAQNLAIKAKELGAKFVHVSTDFVFDGKNSRPYFETDAKNPLSVYGKTKSEGEDAVLKANPDSVILRTSWVYSAFGKNFFTTILNLAQEKEKLTIIADQIGTPTWARDLAWASYQVALQEHSGIYHFSNEGVASWYDFAHAIVDAFGFDCEVLPIPTEKYPTPATRPSYSVLNKEKFRETFGIENAHWRDCVQALALEFMEDEMGEMEEE